MVLNSQSIIQAGSRRWLATKPQLAIGIAISCLVPFVAFIGLLNNGKVADIQLATLASSLVAVLVGYAAFRRLNLFPGSYSGYMLMSMSASFALVALLMFMFRFDYSRPQLFTAYILAAVFFTAAQVAISEHKILRLGIVPGGRGDDPPAVRNVQWIRLESPSEPLPDLGGVVVDLRAELSDEWESAVASFALQGLPVYHAPDAFSQLTGLSPIEHLSENTLGSLNPNDLYLRFKSLVDRVLAAVLVLVLMPVLLAIALVIVLDSRGGAIFRQRRVGFRGEVFMIWKFRTMHVAQEAPALTEAHRVAMTMDNDPRITRVGRVLRRYRIDELPQIVNILAGDMSFIGPRPEAEALSSWYSQEIPFYHYRHILKPGLTGWAQVSQGHVAELADVRSKVYLDFFYIRYFSFWLDVLILLRTVAIISTGFGAK
ncbi:sugar transferase [Sphingomonas sp. IC-56]|uniref:sugar transferase n=1 Tax=Sphingomonas sp. IC-56 TaxID=2898529 RepID=UPI001E3E6565|nr:sugar transferase [Sphingomonas sp. IC-56]MCD2323308.1 sugar transferase [Sphingomonas sp. IC-56]